MLALGLCLEWHWWTWCRKDTRHWLGHVHWVTMTLGFYATCKASLTVVTGDPWSGSVVFRGGCLGLWMKEARGSLLF